MSRADVNAPELPKVAHPDPVPARVLTEIDWITQEACEQITTLCRVGLQVLAPDVHALAHVRRLLQMIDAAASSLENDVNGQAGAYDADHVDQDGRSFRDRMTASLKRAATPSCPACASTTTEVGP